jgi:DNA processing protein
LPVGAHIVTYKDNDYPASLRQIPDPPAVLFVRGDIRESDRFAVAIVGTRRPSEYGRAMTLKISRDLAKRGLSIVSGGARGIDTAAHIAALQANGRTIAVLGSGIDVPYPSENRGLLDRISKNGAVISEFIPGTRPDGWRFPARNRIVSGLSLGVLVVESLNSGGAMITVDHANDQGRDVWAVPGCADNSPSEGPHKLIKEGAKLVERAEDIFEELGLFEEAVQNKPEPAAAPPNLTAEQKAVIQVLNLNPKHVDDISSECNLSSAIINSTLTMLEMLGLVRRVPGNAYVRAI